MDMQADKEILADANLFAEECDEPIAAWTLNELDHLADLGSVRAAWAGADD